MNQCFGPKIQWHVKHPAGNGGSPEDVFKGHSHLQDAEVPDRAHGHPKNTDYFTWGAYVYHWQPFGAYFSSYRLLKWVYSIKSKSGITTSDVEVLETLIRPKFNEVPNIITCCGRNTFVVVECCWACAAVGYLVKLCPTRNPVPISQPTPDQSRVEAEKRASSGPVEWTEELRRGAKTQLRHHSVAGKTATAAI